MSTIKILRLTNVMSYKYIFFSPNLIFIPAEGVLSNTPMNSSDSQPNKIQPMKSSTFELGLWNI